MVIMKKLVRLFLSNQGPPTVCFVRFYSLDAENKKLWQVTQASAQEKLVKHWEQPAS